MMSGDQAFGMALTVVRASVGAAVKNNTARLQAEAIVTRAIKAAGTSWVACFTKTSPF
jgi:hypothetical protein